MLSSQLLRRAVQLQSQVPLGRLATQWSPAVVLARSLQTSARRSITKSCNVEDVHVAETENEAANEFLGVRFNAAKIRKYSAELEVGGRVVVGGDFWTPMDAAKAYDKLVASHGDETTPRNFS
ncbi:hypothetical protein PF005_g23232 [Phytophthora fragariae]|uniref:AP2/ERF domain-containing protein n=1 Tax=Phytophthora fragariae TaxID=53985 RepID=A0A6A3E284_9STRA|nr:hypothetical protein PF003_g14090 [Phytophthora fragariae]KAE8901873.1 hypothetical protein PF003_g14093 [Phytophthora fragariae]KAE8925807.1 hypothetical protein PF009_g23989 [Phytophthora fragariae]KAE8925811.1 hypothetical protein PF009_g23991 [Phytophthora fragariae]KAE8973849.1 hypothetical protein PF011_g25094 [Phytophthora fragariae]